jgi:hypothetical protein
MFKNKTLQNWLFCQTLFGKHSYKTPETQNSLKVSLVFCLNFFED